MSSNLDSTTCISKIKPGAPFLIYLYDAFDNRPTSFSGIWKISDVIRRGISSLPTRVKHFVAEVIAFTVYYPLARIALVFEKIGFEVSAFPLSIYRDKTIIRCGLVSWTDSAPASNSDLHETKLKK